MQVDPRDREAIERFAVYLDGELKSRGDPLPGGYAKDLAEFFLGELKASLSLNGVTRKL